MSRNDDSDLDDDRPRRRRMSERDERPRRGGGFPAWAIVLIVVGGLTVLGCGGVGVFFWLVGTGVQKARDDERAKAIPREDFRKLVVGKTEAEIIAAVGQPSSTADLNSMKWWYFDRKTKDPATGTLDTTATITVEEGKASSVTFR